MRSGVRITGLKAAQARLAALNAKVTKATAASLNQVARLAATEANASMGGVFERANAFTRMAVYAPPDLAARSTNLTAVVGIRPLQARYLSLEILGGTRTPASNTRLASQALVLPGSGTTPLPSGFIRRLAARAQADQARRQAVAEAVFLAILDRCAASDIKVSASRNSGNFGPRLFAKRPDKAGLTAQEFDGAMVRLFADGRIRNASYGRSGDPRQHIVRAGQAGSADPEGMSR